MPASPKRKNDQLADDGNDTTKRPRIAANDAAEDDLAEEIPIVPAPTSAPDSLIDHRAAIKYWSSTEPTVNGVLGGYPQVSRIDLQGSSNFFARLRRQSKHFPPSTRLARAVDCGAGIGRITAGFLTKIAKTVDVVEPVAAFTDQIKTENVGEIYNVGLEEWHPDRDGLGPYDLIWNQWCLGQLTDAQVVVYLRRLPAVLSEGGWIVVKENMSNSHVGEDVFDETDSSVTRTDEKFRSLFEQAALRIVSNEVQRGFPKDLYPVRAYALQPK